MKYLFWTGGYDSTYRLCYLVIHKKEKVQPIYIIDKKVDDVRLKYNRKNVDIEIKTMENIRKKIIQQYPYTKYLIMPVIYYDNIKLDKDIVRYSNLLYKIKKLPRRINQFASMAQISRNLNIPIEVGVVKEHHGRMRRLVRSSIDCKLPKCNCENDECFVNMKRKVLMMYKNLQFPIIDLTKEKILEHSKQYHFYDILSISWSYWFPKKGKACGKCPMCKARIIDHPEK
jgi:7-cyano-7-deazaguanine synthase in queuosine biosynthesis